MRSDVTVEDVDTLVGQAGSLISKLHHCKTMMTSSQLESAFLHSKEIKRYMEKVLLAASAWEIEIDEQCNARRNGIRSAQDKLRARYSQPARRGPRTKK